MRSTPTRAPGDWKPFLTKTPSCLQTPPRQALGGPRAALRTPPSCGTFAARGTFTPWSGNAAVKVDGAFEITEGPSGGACPQLPARPAPPAPAPRTRWRVEPAFNLRGSAEAAHRLAASRCCPPAAPAARTALPLLPRSALLRCRVRPGTGAGQEASPSCPAASQVGTVTSARRRPQPFYTSGGRAYLAGPYKGAPLSLGRGHAGGGRTLDSARSSSGIPSRRPRNRPITASAIPSRHPHGHPARRCATVSMGADRQLRLNRQLRWNPMTAHPSLGGSSGATAVRRASSRSEGCDRTLQAPPLAENQLKGKTKRGGQPGADRDARPPRGRANTTAASGRPAALRVPRTGPHPHELHPLQFAAKVPEGLDLRREARHRRAVLGPAAERAVALRRGSGRRSPDIWCLWPYQPRPSPAIPV